MNERERGARRLDGLRRRVVAAALVGALAILACAGSARADGAALYDTLCASCHGKSGHGDGPAAAALMPPPSDLTRSTLTLPELMKVIDGRRTVRAHGNSAMPVWGRNFEQALTGSGREHRDALQQLRILAEHVRSLERSPGSPLD